MTTPLDIRKVIVTRVTSLANTVIRGKRRYHENELPAINVYMVERTLNEEVAGDKLRVDSEVVVEYHKELASNTEPDDQADAMLVELRTAIEISPRTLGGLVIYPGITWASDDIEYPDDGGDVVSVTVSYSVPHVDQFG